MRHAFVLDIAADLRAVRDLSAGGVFVANAEVQLEDECSLILRAGTVELRVVARVVLVTEEGAGLEIVELTSETRQRIAELVEHLDLVPAKTLTGELASRGVRRKPDASFPPRTRRNSGSHRLASGSIAPPSQKREPNRDPDDGNDD